MKEKIKEPSPKSSNGHQIASRFMPANPALNLEGSKLPVNLAATAVATSSKSVVDRRILPMRLSSLLTLGKTGESRDWKIVFIFIDVVCFCFRLPQFLLVSSFASCGCMSLATPCVLLSAVSCIVFGDVPSMHTKIDVFMFTSQRMTKCKDVTAAVSLVF